MWKLLWIPPVIAMLNREIHLRAYWRSVLRYCEWGNLQALLDEHVHFLLESLGLMGKTPEEQLLCITESLHQAVTLRGSQTPIHTYTKEGKKESFHVNCRYALRFGNTKFETDDKSAVRAVGVREAFNSPFRPFVLASTSIGQEGLDFHGWCHAITHWNLPSNPVNLEQREGRIHRYKGHAVRKNIAQSYGLSILKKFHKDTDSVFFEDPWKVLFQYASENRRNGGSDLIPFWIFEEGNAKIERRIPLFPLSNMDFLISSLQKKLARYRLTFGQPHQEDLLALFADISPDEIRKRTLRLQPSEILSEENFSALEIQVKD
ncbi:MAG: helicase-related protein [Planctomycetia bacterium]|nr:helicase-related protein [Planctomycetia bacterium]